MPTRVFPYRILERTLAKMFFQQLVTALLFCISAVSWASTSHSDSALKPSQWLEKMQRAAIEENYRGTFVFSRGEMMSSMRIVHRYQNDLEEERLTQLDGEMGEIVRRGEDVMCVFPDNRVVKLEKNKVANKVVQAFANFMPNHAFYELKVDGYDRLGDRSSVRMAVKAKDHHRYSYVLTLDQKTGLLLRSSLQNQEGKELEHFQYTQIDFPDSISDAELRPLLEGKQVTHEMIPSIKSDTRWPSQTMWSVTWTPPGFMQVNATDEPGDNVMLFSDGLATYSIFIEMIEKDLMPEGASMVGATVAYAQQLAYGDHRYAVTVVGEVPAMTAMKVAESVQPKMDQ